MNDGQVRFIMFAKPLSDSVAQLVWIQRKMKNAKTVNNSCFQTGVYRTVKVVLTNEGFYVHIHFEEMSVG